MEIIYLVLLFIILFLLFVVIPVGLIIILIKRRRKAKRKPYTPRELRDLITKSHPDIPKEIIYYSDVGWSVEKEKARKKREKKSQVPKKIKCRYCGNTMEITTEDRFCQYCGSEID